MRERILAAAIEVIKERGVVAATTKEIARTAGVSEGSLYNHFSNKSDLYGAAIAQVAGGIRGAMMEMMGAVGQNTVEENLARLAAAAVRFYGEMLPMTGPALADPELLAWVRAGRPGGAPPGHANGDGPSAAPQPPPGGPAQGHASLIVYLEAERAAGRLRPEAAAPYLATALLGACQQHAFLTRVSGAEAVTDVAGLPLDPDVYGRALVKTLLAGHLPG